MIDTITFDTENSKLIVVYKDGTTKEYTKADVAQYLIDNPDRLSDVISMGWN
jgi:hypothetical protein